jgi:peptidase E
MAEAGTPLFLIAGGRGMRKRRGPDPLLQAAIGSVGLERPKIAYLGVASGDDTAFRLWFTRLFRKAGAGEVRLAPLCGRSGKADRAKAVLEASDLVFVSGGDVEEGMRVLNERDMTGFLRSLYRSGKPFFGTSAGSILLSQSWVRWRDPNDDESAELFPCLGLVPILCDAHGEEDDWEELKVLLALSPTGAIGHGIASGAAIIVGPDGCLFALGGKVDRFRKGPAGVSQIKGLVPEKTLDFARRSLKSGG